MKINMSLTKLSTIIAVAVVVIPATFASAVWISTRASAEDLKQVAATVERTADAVEGLTYVVYSDQLYNAQEILAELQYQKDHADDDTWTRDDEADLLRVERRVDILQTQLDAIIQAEAEAAAKLSEEQNE
ncbi:MAG: hypothetical protein KAI41_06140 [Hyphomicrobiaceae bacterium]|nr:hypothetical protein [Hyphomicrobiaceae bacterium]